MLCDLKRVLHLDSKIPQIRLQFAMPEQELHGPEILRLTVDQGRL